MSNQKRLYYLDNIRIALTILVAMHHAAIAYGGEGLHPYKDPNPDILITIPLMAILALIAGIFSDPAAAQKLLGGLSGVAFGFSVWESILMVSIIIWILYYFRANYNFTTTRLQRLAANAYTVYIIHQTILIIVHVGLHNILLPSSLKFVVAVLITVPACFLLSALIRQIPVTRHVLG